MTGESTAAESKEPGRAAFRLGPFQSAFSDALAEMDRQNIMTRIWRRDHTVWNPEPKEISNRLGWLNSAVEMSGRVQELESAAREIQSEGFRDAVLLGMGGSSLAPEVLMNAFGAREGYPALRVMDSTDPQAVLSCAGELDPARTVFIVSTKSGGTVETISLFKFFFRWTAEKLGEGAAGSHFLAVTDKGSLLEDFARKFRFRGTCLNDPEIGGRYSVFSYFGLLPGALIGADIGKLLERGKAAMRDCGGGVKAAENPAAQLGAALSVLASRGRDKLTVFPHPALAPLGEWLEQLLAESTGKDGRGILPVIGEPAGDPSVYGNDRVFLNLSLKGENPDSALLSRLAAAGHPILEIRSEDLFDIGYQFFLWEISTAVAGSLLGINPFDQPNVESAKVLARSMISEFLETCTLPPEAAVRAGRSPGEALRAFLDQSREGDYATFQAFLAPSRAADRGMLDLRKAVRDHYRLATTAGYGPRYLHSTGQLHKGDRGNGLFIQFTADSAANAGIPDEPDSVSASISFGTLRTAQALGDKKALTNGGRRVLHIHLGDDISGGLQNLAEAVR